MSRGARTKYKPEFCEMLIDHMRNGFTFGSFAAVVKVNRDTIFEWAKNFEDFAYAKGLGEAELQYSDEKLLRDVVRGRVMGGNITGLIFKFKNCHGWTDRQPDQKLIINNIAAPEAEVVERVKQLETATLLKIVKDYEKKAN